MRTVINLNHKWAFTKDAGKVPEKIRPQDYWVSLPHTWNNIDGQDGGNDYYRGLCYYMKEFEKSELPENERYYLEFLGANASACVYLNGKKVAEHDGGYSTWRVDITQALSEHNFLVVGVSNEVSDKVYPQQADFTFYGGLYRDVNLIAVPQSHFDLDYFGSRGIEVTPTVKGNDASVDVKVWVTGAKPGQKLHFCIEEEDGSPVSQMTREITDVEKGSRERNAAIELASFEIKDVHLWNGRKDPYLYRVHVCLTEDESELDCVCTNFGCRSFVIDPDKGFLLNGKSYPLRGVSRHQDRWELGNAILPVHHKEDMDMICEMGATTIRLAHYQHDPYFYDLCDERGMVVWAEIPYISVHMSGGRENTISQMKELIVQNYNHPSIVVWGLSNEITMTGKSTPDLIENHEILNDLVHSMDPTRLTTIAAITACDIHDPYIQIPDVVSYNHYFGWYGGDTSMNGPWLDKFHETFPKIPIGMSEYGCEALDWHTSDPQQGDYTEEYQAYYHEELIKQLFARPYLWATHVWNMFDFGADARCEGGEDGQNHKGLVTFDRKYKKDAFYAYKAWLSDEPFVHICGKRYVDRVEPETKVTVYSNQPKVELFVNGKSLGTQTCPEHFFYFQVPNEGESTLIAVAGDCVDESQIRKVDTFNEAYRLREKGTVLNWFDITEKDGYYSLNDKMNDVLASEEGRKLFETIMKNFDSGEGSPAMLKPESIGQMMDIMGGFTVLRLMKLMGAANITVTKQHLLDMNRELNRIPKPEKR